MRLCFWVVMQAMIASMLAQANTPPWFENQWLWELREDDDVGARPRFALTNSEIKLIASDVDRHQRLRYAVTGTIGTRYFTVDADSGVVKLREPFDREVSSKYRAKFTVTDGVDTVEQEADIRIVDVNDNSPRFTRDRYVARIPEDAPVGTEVIRVSASDPDTGMGGSVRYLLEGTAASFQLGEESGILTLAGSIDYESISEYRLSVVAQDRDIFNPLSSTTTVFVKVDDVQDTPPVFYLLPYDRTIKENVEVGSKVVTVSALDGDRGMENDILYSLVSGNEDGAFLLSTGEIRVAGPIDRDARGFSGVYTLTVRAAELSRKQSTLGAHSEITFDIIVDDVNDERAHFDQRAYELSLPESTPVGMHLPIVIPVVDIDQGPNSDVTMSVDWKASEFLTASPVTFRRKSDVTLVLKRELDYEKQKRVRIKLFANETNDPGLFSYCDVIITVVNENDNAPVFDRIEYIVNVSEKAAVRETLVRVKATDDDLGRFGQVLYSVDPNQREISVNKRNGDVKLLKKLDYETAQRRQYVITAQDVGSQAHQARALLTINVLDENDNAPVFESFPNLSVMENRRYPMLAVLRAKDRDSYPYNIIRYAMDGGDFRRRFTLTNENGTGVLSLIEPLDFEAIDGGRIELTISASSGNLQTTATLEVTVEDQNDHRPKFTKVSNIAILENVGFGTKIGSVRASDKDSGNNGKVVYYISQGEKAFSSAFRLNGHTGDITVKPGASPDFEKLSKYNVTVTAEDTGNPPLSSEASFSIDIIDVNDNAPRFEFPLYEVTILENTPLRDLRVTASDEDSGNNGIFRYSITHGNPDDLFSVGTATGEITANGVIDFEEIGESLTLIVQAADMGTEPMTSTTVVKIRILDSNDNIPRFLRTNDTNFIVTENVAGPFVATFKAEDSDSGINAKLSYSIVAGNENDRFTISPLDGELRVKRGTELDREQQETYNLTIGVADGGIPQLTAFLEVTIIVKDVNDNSPRFIDLPVRVNLSENSAVGSELFRLEALDPDLGEFGEVEFTLTSPNQQFDVNSKDGRVYLAKPLDRESVSDYRLHITARDNLQSLLHSRKVTKTVQVVVDDVNDHRPRFIGTTPYHAAIAENSPPGSRIVFTKDAILATDDDEGENARVTYSFPRNERSTLLFNINPRTGLIHTTASIDRESLSSEVMTLTVRASDVGNLFTDTTVVVTVDDVNDNAPRCQHRRMKTRVLESVQPGHVIARVTASDPDKGHNGRVLYRIQSGAFGQFTMNAHSGVIYLAAGKSLDRELTSQYTLTVAASDNADNNPLTTTCVVIVTIDDVNDCRPKFFSNNRPISILENSPVGRTIAQLVATDDDLNARLTYAMTSTAIYDSQGRPLVVDGAVNDVMQTDNAEILDWFQLNSTTGEIILKSSDLEAKTAIDREVCSSIYLTFVVRDEESSSEELSTSIQPMTLQIDIVDQNDNSPSVAMHTSQQQVDVTGEVVVEITEECEIGTNLVAFSAYDKDQGSNGKVVFQLLNQADHFVEFQDENSGVIVSTSRIDRERLAPSGGPAWINVTIVAQDLGFPESRSTLVHLRMRVEDINDNDPRFLRPVYLANIPEDASAGTTVTSVKASDDDDGQFADITYKLMAGTRVFGIHAKKGTIYVRHALDREMADEYTLRVMATDNMKGAKEERLQATAQVTVHITDVNDNKPVFVLPLPSPLEIMENTSTGTSVARVTATDADEGINGHVTYSLLSTSGLFAIDPFTGDLITSRTIVASPRHPTTVDLTVLATDGGGLHANVSIEVQIVDVNDHKPCFSQPDFEVIRLTEELPGGTFVTKVTASDDDVGLNAVLRYDIITSDAAKEKAFLIDDVTGRIVTSYRLDREIRHSYALHVQVHDLGVPQQRTSKIINVILDDINDNLPVFPRNELAGARKTIHVMENVRPGAVIGSIPHAVDRDERPEIFYHILSQDGSGEWRQTFKLKKDRIVLKEPLDREQTSRYVLIIGATNNPNFSKPNLFGRWDTAAGLQTVTPASLKENEIVNPISLLWDPSRDTSLLQMTIVVDDVNDERPGFARKSYVTAVETNSKVGSFVAKMNATDPDLDDILTYHLESCQLILPDNTRLSQCRHFAINKHDGVITTARSLLKRRGRYLLQIIARDSANLSASTTVEVQLRQKSKALRFVVNSSPKDVESKREALVAALGNATNSIATIEAIQHHFTSDKQRDVTRSDVTIRLFDSKHDLKMLLDQCSEVLARFFAVYFVYDTYEKSGEKRYDILPLQTGIVILLLILVLIIIVFIVCLIYMRRKYREELKKLKEQFNQQRSTQSSPSGKSAEIASTSSRSYCKQTPRTFHPPPRIPGDKDAPALASTLLWSPSAMRRTTRSLEVGDSPQMTHRDMFQYDGMTLHATGYEKSLTPLHGSDSGSSF